MTRATKSVRKIAVTTLLGLALGLMACDASAPARGVPERALGSNRIVFVNPAGQAADRVETILDLVFEATAACAELLPLERIRIEVAYDVSQVVPGYGVGGYTPNATTIYVSLDPALDDRLLRHRLAWTVAHEVHHAVRWRDPGYGTTLLERMVSEGLADHFAREVLGASELTDGPVPPWTHALEGEDRQEIYARARPLLNRRAFSHPVWFYGRGTLPVWTGYTLGYELVGDLLATEAGATAAGWVQRPAQDFWPTWADPVDPVDPVDGEIGRGPGAQDR